VSSGAKQETALAEITHRFDGAVSEFGERQPRLMWELQEHLGREPVPADVVRVFELKIVYDFELNSAASP
jgi:hypothetical protein